MDRRSHVYVSTRMVNLTTTVGLHKRSSQPSLQRLAQVHMHFQIEVDRRVMASTILDNPPAGASRSCAGSLHLEPSQHAELSSRRVGMRPSLLRPFRRIRAAHPYTRLRPPNHPTTISAASLCYRVIWASASRGVPRPAAPCWRRAHAKLRDRGIPRPLCNLRRPPPQARGARCVKARAGGLVLKVRDAVEERVARKAAIAGAHAKARLHGLRVQHLVRDLPLADDKEDAAAGLAEIGIVLRIERELVANANLHPGRVLRSQTIVLPGTNAG